MQFQDNYPSIEHSLAEILLYEGPKYAFTITLLENINTDALQNTIWSESTDVPQ